MEGRRQYLTQCTGVLVCRVHDYIVRFPPFMPQLLLILYSVLIPWFTLREVPVEVEIVSLPMILPRT